jgi:predicted RNA binding protein YcfA (HicA-like mRNA interferase family)
MVARPRSLLLTFPYFVAKLLSQKIARKLLEEHGWVCTEGGKHSIKMEKAGERPITLPMHRGQMYGKGLSARIRKQAGLG